MLDVGPADGVLDLSALVVAQVVEQALRVGHERCPVPVTPQLGECPERGRRLLGSPVIGEDLLPRFGRGSVIAELVLADAGELGAKRNPIGLTVRGSLLAQRRGKGWPSVGPLGDGAQWRKQAVYRGRHSHGLEEMLERTLVGPRRQCTLGEPSPKLGAPIRLERQEQLVVGDRFVVSSPGASPIPERLHQRGVGQQLREHGGDVGVADPQIPLDALLEHHPYWLRDV